MVQPNMIVSDLYLAAFQSTVDLINVYLGGIERLQSFQIETMQKMRADQSEISKQIDATGSLEDIRSAQTEFARDQVEKAATYWSGLCTTAYQNQLEMLKEAQAKTMALTADMRQRLDAAPASDGPMISALKLVVDAAQSTCAAGVRTTEEVARLTAAQIETAAASSRHANVKAKRAA
ncbi:MAG: phasin family protein [Rhodocyclaceae bacterium]|nr:phasin family protein [Rhodocyclaceae bacterium]